MKIIRTLMLLTLSTMSILSQENSTSENSAPFRHFVSFQFKADTSEEKKTELVEAFLELNKEIPEIVDLEWGSMDNIEPLNDGFTHSFLVTFKNKEDLAIYLPHKAHEAFVAKIKPHLEKVYVFDYSAKR